MRCLGSAEQRRVLLRSISGCFASDEDFTSLLAKARRNLIGDEKRKREDRFGFASSLQRRSGTWTRPLTPRWRRARPWLGPLRGLRRKSEPASTTGRRAMQRCTAHCCRTPKKPSFRDQHAADDCHAPQSGDGDEDRGCPEPKEPRGSARGSRLRSAGDAAHPGSDHKDGTREPGMCKARAKSRSQ